MVLGASLKPERYSNIAINRLKTYHHEVVCLWFEAGHVSGIAIDTELEDYEAIDTVTLYLNPRHQEAFYDYIISLDPKRVIFNPGTENREFQERLKQEQIYFEESLHAGLYYPQTNIN